MMHPCFLVYLMHTHSSCQADFHYITPRVFLLQLLNFWYLRTNASLHTSLEIVISSGKVKQRTAPPAFRNSLTGDTHTSYPHLSRMRPTRAGQAGITITLPTTTQFAQNVSASSSSSTSGSGTSCSMIALLARSHAAGLIMACRVSSGEKLISKW